MQLALPDLLIKTVQSQERPNHDNLGQLDHLLVVVRDDLRPSTWREFPEARLLGRVAGRAASRKEKIPVATARLDNAKATGISVACAPAKSDSFKTLTAARKAAAAILGDQPVAVGIQCVGFSEDRMAEVLEAQVAAFNAAVLEWPSFQLRKPRPRKLKRIKLFDVKKRLDLRKTEAGAMGNSIARWLTALPANALDAKNYRSLISDLAKQYGLQFSFIGESQLKRKKAGAFLAVSQGNATRDAGIAHLSYRPAGAKQRSVDVALVGKGILFDTGGTNLKPFKSMLDMHGDMQGSAVALGTLVALAHLKVPFSVDAWLAITENRIGARAYKSQDIVTAANGKTIQVIHTDAEGRMVLADTLWLASKTKPKLIVDYATLTGSCVSALSTRYSGAFSNRPNAAEAIISAGKRSGERIWSFPMDEDFDSDLASQVADIKQCAVSGYADHILAARFLSNFVPEAIPWIHIDLSAGDSKHGLAHVGPGPTGFGVRLTIDLLGQESIDEFADRVNA